jgi:hypothetical protein
MVKQTAIEWLTILFATTKTDSKEINFALAATPINLEAMMPFLNCYPDKRKAFSLIKGFKYGFPLHYEGPSRSYEAKNLKSALEHKTIVQQKIEKEIDLGRVEGPFKNSPFINFCVSPIGLVPKKQPGEFRLIHHLSYPKGDSVNDHIHPDLCSVQYTKFDEAVHMIQRLGRGTLMAKADIKSAFRLIPVAKEDFKLLGFKFDNNFYFDKALPFGCSISCAVFESFACFLQWVVRDVCKLGEMEHYLDDFLFGGESNTNQCKMVMETFFQTCAQFGIPIAEEKTDGPTTVLVFLGLEIDSEQMEVRIPLEKIEVLVEQIQNILKHKHSMTLRELQSLLGSLNFMCRAIRPGRPFCRRLINAACGVKLPHHHIKLKKGMRLDLSMWLRFFSEFNGTSIFNDSFWSANHTIDLFTDSSGAKGNGLGIYFKGHWANAAWPDAWFAEGLTNDITLLEYFPILVAVYIWGSQLKNKMILFHCDNESVVQVINRQSSKSAKLMVLVRELTLKCLQFNLVLRAEHIPGVKNGVADSLSRFQMTRFRELAPNADRQPVQVPSHLWSIFNWEPDSF